MARQIPITSIVNTLNLMPPERKIVFNIFRGAGVMREFIFRVGAKPQIFFFHTKREIPFQPFFLPMIEIFVCLFWTDKILHFHLFKLPHAVDKVPWRNFISKSFSNLSDAKWEFRPNGCFYISVIYIDALRSFSAQISEGSIIFYRAQMSFNQ